MQLRFTLRQIEYFVAVGEAGSIIQASERIAVSPPSISAAIAQLEQEFGLQLFVRQHAQGLTLTPGGRRFFNEAKQLLAQAGGLHDVAADIAERVRGPLNVGCLITLAPRLMPQLRKGFEALHPDVRLAQFEDDQASLFDMLNRAMIDLAITYDLEIPQEFSFAPLAALPPYAIFPEDHKLAGRDSVTLDDLVEEPMVLLDLPLSRDYFLSLFHQQGLRPKNAERVPQMASMRGLVANGYGYALANFQPALGLSPDGKRLRHVPLEGSYRPMMIGVATIKSNHRPAVVTAFQEHCRQFITDASMQGMAQASG